MVSSTNLRAGTLATALRRGIVWSQSSQGLCLGPMTHGARLGRFAFTWWVALLMGLAATPAEAVIGVIDDSGRSISLDQPARRIVSLAPSITEMLFAAGAGAAVVGTVEYSDYPDAARRIPRVGNNGLLDMERIVALRPDLIIAWWHGGFDRQLDQLHSLGVPVFLSEPRRLDGIPRTLLAFGRLTGEQSAAENAARSSSAAVNELRSRYAAQREVSVFYQVWNDPLLTIDGKHIISDVIGLCGGRNVFSDLPALVPAVSIEGVIAADPETIVTAKSAGASSDGLDMWRRWPRLRAIAEGNLIVLDADLMSRPSPRLIDGARVLCERLAAVRRRQPR
jgi:iron complex transport system substrate-binding protein